MNTFLRSLAFVSVYVLSCLTASCDRSGNERTTIPPYSTSSHPPGPTRATLSVYTTFYPSQYFAQRIAGEAAAITCPVPAGADPIFWQPTHDHITAYQRADLILINGAGYEQWVLTASLPDTRVIDLSRCFASSFVRFSTVTHQHGSGGAHTHQGIDGHTWMDPLQAKAQAREIARAILSRRPDLAAEIERRTVELENDLDQLDAGFRAVVPGTARVQILASHPAYNYIARRYSIPITNLDLDPESETDLEGLAAIAAAMNERPDAIARIMLWEKAPTAKAINPIRDRFAIEHIVFSPCETQDPEDAAGRIDYLARMKLNLESMAEAVRRAAP